MALIRRHFSVRIYGKKFPATGATVLRRHHRFVLGSTGNVEQLAIRRQVIVTLLACRGPVVLLPRPSDRVLFHDAIAVGVFENIGAIGG